MTNCELLFIKRYLLSLFKVVSVRIIQFYFAADTVLAMNFDENVCVARSSLNIRGGDFNVVIWILKKYKEIKYFSY